MTGPDHPTPAASRRAVTAPVRLWPRPWRVRDLGRVPALPQAAVRGAGAADHGAPDRVVLPAGVRLAGGARRARARCAPRSRTRARGVRLAASAALISVNWLLYVWAVTNGHIVEASLGYFINPLLNVVLGVLVLKERLNRAQWMAVALAAVGVLYLTVVPARPPWIALALAASFGLYGLIRKVVRGRVGAGARDRDAAARAVRRRAAAVVRVAGHRGARALERGDRCAAGRQRARHRAAARAVRLRRAPASRSRPSDSCSTSGRRCSS